MQKPAFPFPDFRRWLPALGLSCLLAVTASAADGVSREEYNALKKQVALLQKQLSTVQEKPATASIADSTASSPSALASLQQEVADLKSVSELTRPGTDKMTIVGTASATFSEYANDSSNFTATFSPIFLWELNDRLLLESEVELELGDTSTQLNLEYAHLTYLLNDYLTIGVGKFLSPMNTFVERYEPKWINKFADTPLGIYDGFLPESQVGVQLRGVVPVGSTRFNFAAYVSNAPRLITDDPAALGQLDFNNFTSVSDNKAVGGRIGFEPVPWIEVGYSGQISKAADPNGVVSSPNVTLQSVDLRVKRDSPALKGGFTLLGQYSWSHVGRETYDADGSLGIGPVTFDNKRDGGYLQVSYRPKELGEGLNHFEAVVRADQQHAPSGAPGAYDEQRVSFGINYYLQAATVLKASFEIDDRTNGEPNQNAILLQLATGL